MANLGPSVCSSGDAIAAVSPAPAACMDGGANRGSCPRTAPPPPSHSLSIFSDQDFEADTLISLACMVWCLGTGLPHCTAAAHSRQTEQPDSTVQCAKCADCTLYIVHCTVYIVHCSLYIETGMFFALHFTLYSNLHILCLLLFSSGRG